MATQAFLDKWRSGTGRLSHLVKIRLKREDAGADNYVYVSSDGVGTLADSGGGEAAHYWMPAVTDLRPIHLPGGFCSTDIPLCTTSLALRADALVTFPQGTFTLRQTIKDHLWMNAEVTIWRHFNELGDFANAQQAFKGNVVSFALEGNKLELQLRQRTDWNKPVALNYIDRQKYPRAIEEAIGLPLPLIYGRIARGHRQFWGDFSTNKIMYMKAFGPASTAQSVLVDKGRGGQATKNLKATVLAAGHQLKSVASHLDYAALWFESDAGPCWIDQAQVEIVNDATGSGVRLPESGAYAWARVVPSGFTTESNQPDNIRTLFEPNDASACVFDYAALKRNVSLTFPLLPNMGTATQVNFIVGYQASANLSGLVCTPPIGSPFPLSYLGSSIPSLVQVTSSLAGWPPTDTWTLRIDFSGASPAGVAKVFVAMAAVNFRPNQELVTSERVMETRTFPIPDQTVGRRFGPAFSPLTIPVRTPPVTEVRGKFFATALGIQDTGSGTYTGTANAVIERAPDIARHLLAVYGGQVDGTQIETDTRVVREDFEAGTAGWTNVLGITSLRNNQNQAPYGPFSVTATSTGTGARGFRYNLPVLADGTYTLSAWYKSTDPGGSQFIISITGTGGSSVGVSLQSTGGLWMRSSVTVTFSGMTSGYVDVPRWNSTETSQSKVIEVDGVQLEQGSTATPFGRVPGSFVEARAYLVDHLGNSLSHGIGISEDVDVGTVLGWLTSESLSQIAISPYSDKFKMHVWREYPDVDYSWRFSRYDVVEPMGPRVSPLPTPRLVTGINVGYDYDARTRTPRSQATLADDKSVGGYEFRNLRDETTEILSGKNDRLNWTRGSAFVATLTAGEYEPDALAQHVQERMRAVDTNSAYWCAYGGVVRASAADRIAVGSPINNVAVLTPGTYTMEALATEAARALNTIDTGWSGSYSRTSRLFTLSHPSASRTINWATAVTNAHASALLGFSSNKSSTTHVGDIEVEEGRFCIVSANAFDLNFQSGPDGSDSAVSVRHCAGPLGFDPSEDKLDGLPFSHGHVSDCVMGNREKALKQTAGRYGARRTVAVQARTIHNTRTARSLRNRIADLLGRPRSSIRFTTRRAPDIERGQVIDFSSDLDSLAPYNGLGSDGSWAGKKFVVTEVTHNAGPTSLDTEIEAVDIAIPATIAALATVGVMMGGVLMQLQAA